MNSAIDWHGKSGKCAKLAFTMLLIASLSMAQSTPDIIGFSNGELSWINTDTSLYYTVEWRASMTGTNSWTNSYRSLQDIRSIESNITAEVPIFLRVVGRTNAASTIALSPLSAILPAGYYNSTNLTQVDTDLISANVRSSVAIFGVTGKAEVVDTTSGDAVAAEMRSGKKAWVDGAEVTGTMPTRTLSASSTTIQAGYYDATTLTAVDADLSATNVRNGAVVFGVTGTYKGAYVPKTGQTTQYRLGDDGNYETGVAPPAPRFTDHGNGTVTDNQTGLMWIKTPLSYTIQTWNNAVDFCEGLSVASYTDWRLPNVKELQSLVDFSQSNPCLPNGHPFSLATGNTFWTSTTYAPITTDAWYVSMDSDGAAGHLSKALQEYVWPVRSGL